MSKKRDLYDNEKERLEALVREQKQQIRQLERRLKRLSKGYRKFLDEEPLDDEPEVIIEEKKMCWDCARGEMVLTQILNRRWRTCNICGKKTRTKIIQD